MLITCSIMFILRPTRSKYGMMMFSPGASVRVYLPNRSMVQSYPCGTVLTPANSVKITNSTSAMAKTSNPVIEISSPKSPRPCGRWPPETEASCPALKLAQNKLADHVHPGLAVVQAWNEGKLLATIVLEYLGVFLRNFFQRFQAIGGKTGSDDRDTAHAVLCELLHGLVGVGLQPSVVAEPRLERQK